MITPCISTSMKVRYTSFEQNPIIMMLHEIMSRRHTECIILCTMCSHRCYFLHKFAKGLLSVGPWEGPNIQASTMPSQLIQALEVLPVFCMGIHTVPGKCTWTYPLSRQSSARLPVSDSSVPQG